MLSLAAPIALQTWNPAWQPAWVSLALTAIIALLGLAGMFFGLRFKTDRVAEDATKMAKKQEDEEHRLNDLITIFKVAAEKQTAINEVVMKALTALAANLEKIDARVNTSEAALLVLRNEWPTALAAIHKLLEARNETKSS